MADEWVGGCWMSLSAASLSGETWNGLVCGATYCVGVGSAPVANATDSAAVIGAANRWRGGPITGSSTWLFLVGPAGIEPATQGL